MRGRNHVAVIQHQTPQSGFTGTGGDWEEFATCYADVRPLRGFELFNAQQAQAHVTTAIETEYIPNVTPAMRVRVLRNDLVNEAEPHHDDNFRFFEITTVINVNEANRSLELLCIEKI